MDVRISQWLEARGFKMAGKIPRRRRQHMTARDKCPAHYNYSNIQPWDVIDAWEVDYYLGNVLKYICRAGRKEPKRLSKATQKKGEAI